MKKSKIIAGIIFLCTTTTILLPYFVAGIYWIGENVAGLPTFLTKNEMLSYLATTLGTLASTFIGVVALLQTKRLDDMSNAPSISIEEVANNPFYRLDSNLLEGIPTYNVGSSNGNSGSVPLYLKFHIHDKTIKELAVSKFVICAKNNLQENTIETLPDMTFLSASGFQKYFLPIDYKFLVQYSVSKMEKRKTYIAHFETDCKTMDDRFYKKRWSMPITYSINGDVVVHSIEGSPWEVYKRKQGTVNEQFENAHAGSGGGEFSEVGGVVSQCGDGDEERERRGRSRH